MDYGRWNEWDGLWTEGSKNGTWSMKCGLKEMRWNMSNEVDNVTPIIFYQIPLTSGTTRPNKLTHRWHNIVMMLNVYHWKIQTDRETDWHTTKLIIESHQ